MCGIAGFVDGNSAPDYRLGAVQRMCGSMQHRGPDDEGVSQSAAATLGMTRLAIFDPANGHQPMQSPDRRFTIIFNGAIYNFRELRQQLAGTDWSFRTECDTEVLLAAFVRWGADCLQRLRGMFAFAVWDEREQSLFLARDPFGIKPLYYRHDGTRLVFASELNALIASRTFAAEFDELSVADYLGWLSVPAPRTIYRDVFSLRPGESATFTRDRFDVRAAWTFRGIANTATRCRTRTAFIGELRERLNDSVRAHLVADVPVGAFLSGGVDSAAVTGLMARASSSRLRTFSIDFAEPGFSEAAAAEATARHFGTEHRTTVLTGTQVAADIPRLLTALDQPTGDGINTYYASQAARAGGVTVALSGLGGDELFGGYPSFRDTPRLARWLRPWRTLPSGVRSAAVRRFQRGNTRERKLADVLQYARTLTEVGSMQRRVFSEPARHNLLRTEIAQALGPRAAFHPEIANLLKDLDGSDAFQLVSAWELRTYMADVLLRDSDVMSMRHSLELRVPLVDRPLIEWLWRQPTGFKSSPDQPKRALLDAVQDILPPGIAGRSKQGFALPFNVWMKRELRPFLEETFSDASIESQGLLNREAVQNLWHGFVAGSDSREWSRVWSLAVLIAFTNRSAVAEADHSGGAAPEIRSTPEIAPRPATQRASIRSRRNRTVLLAPEIFASEGGIPRILQTYLKALCDLSEPDGSVRLVALNDAQISGADLERYTNDRLESWSVCDRSKPRFVRDVLRLSRDCDDLICGHVAQLPVAWLARRANPKLRYHLIAHGIEVWRKFNVAERTALRGATTVYCVSDYTRRELLKNCPLPERSTVVLPNALDPHFTITPGRPLADCAPVILMVTRLTYSDRYKGAEHMIAAMPAIRRGVPDVRLKLVGRGDDVPRLQTLARELALDGAVEFAGYLSDSDLETELSTCRLFALPSSREGFGLVFIEAMAHGRPCLGARAGGIPEVITDSTGVLVEAGDVAQIATAAIDALQRTWDTGAILARAQEFSFPRFREKLGALLTK